MGKIGADDTVFFTGDIEKAPQDILAMKVVRIYPCKCDELRIRV